MNVKPGDNESVTLLPLNVTMKQSPDMVSSEYTQGALPLGPPLKASGRMKRVWGEVNFMNLG